MVILADVKATGDVIVLPPEWGYGKDQLEAAADEYPVIGFGPMGEVRTLMAGELENFREATDELKPLD